MNGNSIGKASVWDGRWQISYTQGALTKSALTAKVYSSISLDSLIEDVSAHMKSQKVILDEVDFSEWTEYHSFNVDADPKKNASVLMEGELDFPGLGNIAIDDLDVTPVVMSNDEILMTVQGNSSDFLPSQSEGEINTLTNAIKTTVTVKNGETLIIEAEESDGISGVPILRYIPVLNLLFRNKNKAKNYLETVIYITPYIEPLKNEVLAGSAKEYKKASERIKKEDKRLNHKGINKLY